MIYFYHWSYCEKADEFFAFVDDGSRHGETIFQIDNTDEMVYYIANGKMNHIDDTEGLEEWLKAQLIIEPEDSLLFRAEMVW
jgi:hypothetical protein